MQEHVAASDHVSSRGRRVINIKLDRIHLGGPKSGLDKISVLLEQHTYCCSDGCCDGPEDATGDQAQIDDRMNNSQAFRLAADMINALIFDGQKGDRGLSIAEWIRTAPGSRNIRGHVFTGGLF